MFDFILATFAVQAASASGGIVPIDHVEGWQILRVSTDQFKGCGMTAVYEGAQQIGFRFPAPDGRQVELISSKPGWEAINSGQDYQVSVEVRGYTFTTNAKGKESNGQRFIRLTLPREVFDKAFSYSPIKFLRVSYRGSPLVSLVPTNRDYEAMIAVTRCLKTFNDPFAN